MFHVEQWNEANTFLEMFHVEQSDNSIEIISDNIDTSYCICWPYGAAVSDPGMPPGKVTTRNWL